MLYGWTENTFDLTPEQREAAEQAFMSIYQELVGANPDKTVNVFNRHDGEDDQGRKMIYIEMEVVE